MIAAAIAPALGAAKAVASALVARIRHAGEAAQYDGFGTCYIEFGAGRIGKVEVDFDTARRLFTLVCVLHWRG